MDNYKELGSFQPGADLLSFAYQISSGMVCERKIAKIRKFTSMG